MILEVSSKGARLMFRIDNEFVQLRMVELQKVAQQSELARRCPAMKREKRMLFGERFMTFFRRIM